MSQYDRSLSCCVWALEGPEPAILERLHGFGLHCIDVRPRGLRSAAARDRRDTLGLDVCCIAASHELPAGAALDSTDADAVGAARAHIEAALTHAADLGAHCAYVVPEPPVDGDSLERYADLLPGLAEHGANLGVRLCIEHFPGTAMPTVAATLGFLRLIAHPNLYLL
ncbi:uncharacterized protein METZ01_LOCUS277899, partial [marine metagenome]